jgi:hypothetical protein
LDTLVAHSAGVVATVKGAVIWVVADSGIMNFSPLRLEIEYRGVI